MPRRSVLAVAAVICASFPAFATSYPPVTFPELVASADVIFVGDVVDVRPFPVNTRGGTIIKTRVVFRIQDPIFGTTNALEAFDFLGGEWGGIGMAVAEMPTFIVGDRRIVFARRDRSANPIVGFTQGLFQVTRDSFGVDRVLTLDGWPLERPENLGTRTPAVGPVGGTPIRLSDFRDRISRTLAETRRR